MLKTLGIGSILTGLAVAWISGIIGRPTWDGPFNVGWETPSEHALHEFVNEATPIITNSEKTRADLVSVHTEVNHCRAWAAEAIGDLNKKILPKREKQTEWIAQVDVPDGNEELHALLQDALTKSLEADEQYKAWLQGAKDQKVKPCEWGHDRFHYKKFEQMNDEASDLKREFAEKFNEAAKELGLRADLSEWKF